MKFFLILLLASLSITSSAQKSWTVTLDGKTISQKSGGDSAQTIHLSLNQLKGKGNLIVKCTESETQKDWERTISLVTSKDRELVVQKGKTFTISKSKLCTLLKANKRLYVYTIALPSDPDLRSRIRVGRVLLAGFVNP